MTSAARRRRSKRLLPTHPRKPPAQKKHDRGLGRRGMRVSSSDKTEIIRLVEQSHLPVRRTLEKLGVPRSSFRSMVRPLPAWRPGGLGRSPISAGSGLEPHPRSGPRPGHRSSPRTAPSRAPANWRCASPTRRRYSVPEALGLPAAQFSGPHHQPGLHRHQGGRRVQGQDHGAQPALAVRTSPI